MHAIALPGAIAPAGNVLSSPTVSVAAEEVSRAALSVRLLPQAASRGNINTVTATARVVIRSGGPSFASAF
jgi:hypothetical protein